MAQSSTSREDTALLAEMLSLPNDGRYPTLELTPQQRRQKTLKALVAQVEARSRQKPLLMILEDAHWADPTILSTTQRGVWADARPTRKPAPDGDKETRMGRGFSLKSMG